MNGVVVYNSGRGCLLRIAVCLHSLRRHYAGPACIMHEDDIGAELCRQIAGAYDAKAELVHFDPPIPPGAHYPFVAKPRLGDITPYDTTIMVDADTIIRAPIDALFTALQGKAEFGVPHFADWTTRGKIAKRISGWRGIMPDEWINRALIFGRAINNGVTVFRKGSNFMRDWARWTERGRARYIPDESSLQVLVAICGEEAIILDHWWNTSCKYDDPTSAECKILHYHGRKHCRFFKGAPAYHADLWYAELEAFRAKEPKLCAALLPTDRHVQHWAGHYKTWKENA